VTNKRRRWIGGIVGVVAVALVAIALWPASDPLADVETVAIRVGDNAIPSEVDVEGELRVVLGDREIRVTSDEAAADIVLELTDFVVNLGDIEISLTGGRLRGKASAICRLTEVRTGKVHVMDFVLTFENETVRAELLPRKFWEFWKRRPAE
jgi:hypothetical protein